MFCDTDLAARIERAERDLTTAACATVRERFADVLELPIAGGLAAFTEPGSPLNKVIGLGFAPFEPREWQAVEAAHARRKAPIQVELSTLADPALAPFLTGRGFQLVGVENVLGRALAPFTPAERPGIRIAASGGDEIQRWLDVIVAGFARAATQGGASPASFDRGGVHALPGAVRWRARRRCVDAHRRRHRAAVRGGDAARAPSARRAERSARTPAGTRREPGLHAGGDHHAAGFQVDAERAARRLRAALQPQRAAT
jgi:hypothetical protein